MTIIPQLMAYLAHVVWGREKPFSLSLLHCLGGVMVASGIGMGTYFLFQFLIPFVGYVESGLVISGFFVLMGGVFLCLKARQKTTSTQEMLLTAKDTLENINIPLSFEKHAGKLVVGAICAGFILAQLMGNKKA